METHSLVSKEKGPVAVVSKEGHADSPRNMKGASIFFFPEKGASVKVPPITDIFGNILRYFLKDFRTSPPLN